MVGLLLGTSFLLGLAPAPQAASSTRGEALYRLTLVRAAPGRFQELTEHVTQVKASVAGRNVSLLLRHAQGDQWDLLLLTHLDSYRAAQNAQSLPEELVAWQQEEFVRGPEMAAVSALFRSANLYHVEMFVALPGKRTELIHEREMVNTYQRGQGRPEGPAFVREQGAEWDVVSITPYRSWKHYGERDDIPPEKATLAAVAAGFQGVDQVASYLRTLILTHHDTFATPVR